MYIHKKNIMLSVFYSTYLYLYSNIMYNDRSKNKNRHTANNIYLIYHRKYYSEKELNN